MIERIFYNSTVRRYTIAFGTVFNGIKINRQASNGDIIQTIPVPLRYISKEKFVSRAVQLSSISAEETKVKETLPAMGFEMLGMTFDSQRKTNTMERIVDNAETKGKFMFNRVPYNFNFGLYVAGRTIDDTLRIVEQIIPYFTPELSIRINDIDLLGEGSDIPIVLDDASMEVDSEGTFDERRFVQWSLTFTMKGYLYAAQRDIALIKKAIVDINDLDKQTFFEGYMSQVDPLNAGTGDEPDIDEQITIHARDTQTVEGQGGSDAEATLGT